MADTYYENDGTASTDDWNLISSNSAADTNNESGTDLETPEEETARLLRESQNDFYTSIGIDPASMKDAPPETIERINSIIAGDAYKASPDLIKTLMGAFSKTVNGKQVTDWDKVGMVGGLLANATGLAKPETPGYKGKVKDYTAVNAPINYNDPNRRPGAGGRQYFTPTQYVPSGGDVDAARTAANQKAQGILSAYTPAAAPTSKWNATNAAATPWARTNPATSTGIAAAAPAFETPEQRAKAFGAAIPEAIKFPERAKSDVLSNLRQGNIGSSATHLGLGLGEGMNAALNNPNVAVQKAEGGILEAAKGRYLRGETDGMADEIDTSIDNRQPAKLSHGEFVVPADVVSHLGNGNSDAGAKKLYQMMDKIRIARTGTKKQGREIDADRFLPGGKVGYSSGGITDGIQRFQTGGPASNTSTAGNLSEWAGDALTTNIGQGIAAANQPYQAYTGPLTAGASDLQQQQFAGLSNIAKTGLTPTQYTKGTFDTAAAQKYMNPYLQTALDPQLKEMQRQSDIARLADSARLAKAGAFGGSRQAIMESEARRNLLDKQTGAIGSGYKNAYDAAMAQYNADMNRGLSTEQAQQAANEASANFGLKSMDALGQAGATQRGIESEGIAADKAQFEEARDWDKKMAQYKQGLFSGMPVATQVNTPNTNPITDWLQSGSQLSKLLGSFTKP